MKTLALISFRWQSRKDEVLEVTSASPLLLVAPPLLLPLTLVVCRPWHCAVLGASCETYRSAWLQRRPGEEDMNA